MVIKRFNVSLEEITVAKSLVKAKIQGGKLSPIINMLLEKWLKEKDK